MIQGNKEREIEENFSREDKEKILNALLEVWMCYPTLRLGQLIVNSMYQDEDLFYISDSKLSERLQEFAERVLAEPMEE